jgi:hypothetical protein
MSRASYERLRSMYPSGRPDARARRYARFWSAVISLGVLPRRWVTLHVNGRTSGRPISLPLGMADLGGSWYLVPMLGQRCNWVRNVRAAGGLATLSRRGVYRCRLVELPEPERAPILKRYLQKVPGARPHIPIDRHAPLADFAAIAALYPVFRVDFAGASVWH